MLVLAGMVILLLLAGCGLDKSQGPVSEERKETTIVDSTGKSITVPKSLNKVVVLNANVAEAMKLLQVPAETIVGVSDTVQENPYLGLDSKPCVGKWTIPDVEKIAELKPQAVLTFGKFPSEDIRSKLEALGIKVIGVDFYYFNEYDQDLKRIATLFGKEKRAAEFLSWKESNLSAITKKLEDLNPAEKIKVACLWTTYFEKGTYKTFAPGSSYDQVIKFAGGNNAGSDLKPSPETPEVSAEWLLEKNPEAVVFVYSSDLLGYKTSDYSAVIEFARSIGKGPVLSKTNAAKNNRLYFINISGLSRFSEAIYFAKWFYPDRFKDVVPNQVLKEYFEKWLGVPFKGRWAYPEF